ncbi:hypothetical protein JTB14_027604 [Gonioctena quinquepunctata]|nr:hypothetical protein JTB14_027604 [Gonioctena quinquepunctata]
MRWIMCECCCRWVHLKCAKEPNISDIDLKYIGFRCHLCKNYEFEDEGLNNTEKKIIERSAYSKLNYVIAHYFGNKFKHCEIKELDFFDYSTLSSDGKGKEMWLTNFVIDLCLGCFLEMNPNSTKNITPVNCKTVSIIFRTFCKSIEEAEIFTDGELDKIPPSRGVLIMPTNTGGNHWVLAVANTNEKKIHFLGPSRVNKTNKKVIFRIISGYNEQIL